MIIGFCGSSSTGKTALIQELRQKEDFRKLVPNYLHVDARAIIRSMGHRAMDRMDRSDLQKFQLQYLRQKIELENEQSLYCTDRTYVDIAAYWLCRDAPGDTSEQTKELLDLCKSSARRYSLHVFLPFGIVPFVPDGYRSENLNLHKVVSDHIRKLLVEWNLPWIEMTTSSLQERASCVLAALK